MRKTLIFWLSSVCCFIAVCILSHLYAEPIDWWSIYSADHSTTDRYYPMLSATKLTYIFILCVGFVYIIRAAISLLRRMNNAAND